METKVIKKRLSKFSTNQLLDKIEKNSLTKDEEVVALEIIEKRTGEPTPEPTEDSNESVDQPTVEEVTAAIDLVYDTDNPDLIKGMISLFKSEVDDYSELSPEERKSIIDYAGKVKSGDSGEPKGEPKGGSGKTDKKSEKGGSTYGFSANSFDMFAVEDGKFLLKKLSGESVDVEGFQGKEIIEKVGGTLKKGEKVTITTAKGKKISGELVRISFSSKPYVFYPYIKDSSGKSSGFRLSAIKSITKTK